jgi:glycosyltransferase involved in cell wall biosynthesis
VERPDVESAPRLGASRRLLVLAYYFPPQGGAGVQRTVKLLRHLPGLGWRPIVVTGPAEDGPAWAPHDASLGIELDPALAVVRVPGPPLTAGRVGRRVRRTLGLPTRFGRWWSVTSARYATDVARREQVDVLYTSMSPFESAIAAATAARASGVPWVADLRDPWALDEWLSFPSALHRELETRRMGRRLASASAVVANTEEAASAIGRRFPQLAERMTVIPNGWDADDFAGPSAPRDDGNFRIVLAGYSHVPAEGHWLARALGGVTPGLDVSARSHRHLLEALALLVERHPGLAARVELHVAGAGPRSDPSDAVPRLVEHGYLPHHRAVALMRSADLLFLPMHDLTPGVRATTVPGKTYEYLASGRPILAALPDGDARDMLAGLAGVTLCRPTDVDCMVDALVAAIEGSPPSYLDRSDAIRDLERGAQARRLAAVLERVVARR